VAGPLTWLAALRLTLCVAIAEVVALMVPLERSYWITLTVGSCSKPDFGSVFGRAVLRGSARSSASGSAPLRWGLARAAGCWCC